MYVYISIYIHRVNYMCHDKNIVYVVLGHPIHMGIFAMDIYIYINPH